MQVNDALDASRHRPGPAAVDRVALDAWTAGDLHRQHARQTLERPHHQRAVRPGTAERGDQVKASGLRVEGFDDFGAEVLVVGAGRAYEGALPDGPILFAPAPVDHHAHGRLLCPIIWQT